MLITTTRNVEYRTRGAEHRSDEVTFVISSPFGFAQDKLRRDIWPMREIYLTSRH